MSSSSSLARYLVLVSLLAVLSSWLPWQVSASPPFRVVPRPDGGARFPNRTQAATFAWGGAIWVAGGQDIVAADTVLSDVWGSYDFGRTWTQPVDDNGRVVDLPGPCLTGYNGAVIYAGTVYLVCSSIPGYFLHSSYMTMTSTSLTLSSWNGPIDDGCGGCGAFSVNRMAVPFDGVGTLVTLDIYGDIFGGDHTYDPAHVVWQSATGNFQPQIDTNSGSAIPGSGIIGQWVAFQVAGSYFSLPWPRRFESSSAVDSEGLQLIMTGGVEAVDENYKFHDVWQLTWQSSFVNPLVSQLTDAAQFSPRTGAMLAMVHDWYILAGGLAEQNPDPFSSDLYPHLNDAYISGDLGTTWTLLTDSVLSEGFAYVNRLTLGRRLFIIAPTFDAYNLLTNDVVETVW